ncbi:sigma-70 family RNA polymerase sigma factor [Sphingobium yanoikuyae]|uniref:Sigma-70 family RNA polymerase sigma factor n=1 Tax=Sphingobium yanoikuyae TaxID=13690 RepID=A0A3G2URT2_SPHYA|nr:sigma-70 family RNA polymerase sigma factor [Sphingobium yanoikuyae]AYO77254.1 sigma-70 family RNA polymerase sigma factor [Sphingobium yanoikuyae]QNG48522.1 sigma-70 family RNA polymerase sigma factor [Sphingobium yanoikuyae]
MTYHHDVSRCLARFVARMRDRVADEICLARIERYLADGENAGLENASVICQVRDGRIDKMVAQMEPLTRAILILVVARKMSVAEVARRFRMSEERVCRHFRLAVEGIVGR